MAKKKPEKKPKPEPEFKCDVCGAEAEYELLGRVSGSDLYQVEHRYCARCAGVAEEPE